MIVTTFLSEEGTARHAVRASSAPAVLLACSVSFSNKSYTLFVFLKCLEKSFYGVVNDMNFCFPFGYSLSTRLVLPTCHSEWDNWSLWSVRFFLMYSYCNRILDKQIQDTMYLNCGTLIRYKYQITPNSSSTESCGGADMWADIQSTEEIFCPAGYYCPTTTKRDSCSSGYWSTLCFLYIVSQTFKKRSGLIWS